MKIYYYNIEELDDIEKFEQEYDKASEERKEKIKKIKFDEKKKQSLGADMLIRHIAHKENISNEIRRSQYDKPEFLNDKVQFNISHSENYVLAASSKYPVGVDVQKIKNSEELSLSEHKLIKKYFTDSEKKYIFAANSNEEIVERFFRLWTMKEAFVKMEGVGIRRPFYTFEIRFDDDIPSISANDTYTLLEIDIAPGYKATVCYDKRDDNYIIEEVQ